MAVDVLKLKRQAVAAGMDKDEARKATRAALEAFLADGGKKAPAKKSGTVAKKKTTGTGTPARKPAAKKAPVRKPAAKPAAKKSAPTKAPARKPATKAGAAKRPVTNSDAVGRHQIETLDFSATDGWNPRSGSAVDVIFRALKKVRGNTEKAFDILLPNIADFVGPKKQDGTKRTKADRENMLRYRINRTKFDFAVKTGQHEVATERVEYGTGAYATTRAKSAPRKAPARAASKPNTRKPAARKTATRKTARKR